MTRKMHNTLMAVIASSSLLVIGLIAGAPVVPDLDVANATLAPLEAQADDVAEADERPADATPQRQVRAARHSRQALAMPFFSFAPRG